MRHSTGKPTMREAERIERMLKLGCVACMTIGIPNFENIEVHHLLSGNVRMGHWFTIPLDSGHHRAVWSPRLLRLLTPEQQVSVADGRKSFSRIYGTEKSLWEKVQFVLQYETEWPQTKIVPRRIA